MAQRRVIKMVKCSRINIEIGAKEQHLSPIGKADMQLDFGGAVLGVDPLRRSHSPKRLRDESLDVLVLRELEPERDECDRLGRTPLLLDALDDVDRRQGIHIMTQVQGEYLGIELLGVDGDSNICGVVVVSITNSKDVSRERDAEPARLRERLLIENLDVADYRKLAILHLNDARPVEYAGRLRRHVVVRSRCPWVGHLRVEPTEKVRVDPIAAAVDVRRGDSLIVDDTAHSFAITCFGSVPRVLDREAGGMSLGPRRVARVATMSSQRAR